MKKIIKALPWLLSGVAAYFIISYGFDFARAYLRARVLEEASKQYEEKLRKKDVEIAAGKVAYGELSEKAGRDRETLRLAAEEALRKKDADYARLKSRSAEELQAKKATIAEVLAEKKKDELALVAANGTIGRLEKINEETREAWRLSDEEKDRLHAKIVLDLEEKYATCDSWRKAIEKELRPSFWKKVKDAGKFALAFSAGYATGRIR